MSAPTTALDFHRRPDARAAAGRACEPTVFRISRDAGDAWANGAHDRIELWNGDPTRTSGASVVKSTRRRIVARFPEEGSLPAVYVKQEKILGVLNRVRVLLTGSHAELEFTNAEELIRRGVPGPRPVAFAAWKTAGITNRTLSITEELRGGVRLDEYFAWFRDARKREAIGEVAVELARLHQQDIDLTDCHRANFLMLTKDGGASRSLAMLDLATVRFHDMGIARRVNRLGQLLHSLRPALSYEERRLFVERYARTMEVGHDALEDLIREVRAAEERVNKRRERSRDRRCVVDSTEYYVRSSLTTRVFARRSMEIDVARQVSGVGLSDKGMERVAAKIVKQEGRNECYLMAAGGVDYFVKRVQAASPAGAVVDAFRGSRGRRAWRAAHALARRGIPTPKAFALVETGLFVPARSALVTEVIEGASTLLEVASRFERMFDTRAQRVNFLTNLGDLIGRLHNSDVDHGDLAIKNILVVNPKDPRFYFIDLEAVGGWRSPLSRDRIIRALMQLDDAPRPVSRVDRMRFLVAYERATRTHLTGGDIAEIRRLLRQRFTRSGRNYLASGPR